MDADLNSINDVLEIALTRKDSYCIIGSRKMKLYSMICNLYKVSYYQYKDKTTKVRELVSKKFHIDIKVVKEFLVV